MVIDDFYENPDEVRDFALSCKFAPHLQYHKGQRTEEKFIPNGIKEKFEKLVLGKEIGAYLTLSVTFRDIDKKDVSPQYIRTYDRSGGWATPRAVFGGSDAAGGSAATGPARYGSAATEPGGG